MSACQIAASTTWYRKVYQVNRAATDLDISSHSSAAPTGAAAVEEIRWSVSTDSFRLGMFHMQKRAGLTRLPEERLR